MLIRPPSPAERPWIEAQSAELGGPVVVSARRLRDLREHETAVAEVAGSLAGLIVWRDDGEAIEVLAIWAAEPERGVGTALIEHVAALAREAGKAAIWLCTTNDNVDALRFYQRRGFRVCDYWVGGFADVLRLKGLDASQAVIGRHGIEITDVVLLSRPVASDRSG